MYYDTLRPNQLDFLIYKPKFIIMKKPKMNSISIVAGIIFAVALILNVQANLDGDLGMFGKQLFAQTNGSGGGSGSGSGSGSCPEGHKSGYELKEVDCFYWAKIQIQLWPPAFSCERKPGKKDKCVKSNDPTKCCNPQQETNCHANECNS